VSQIRNMYTDRVIAQGADSIRELAEKNGMRLAGADLAGANLAGANLAGANLAGADLVEADLAGTNLQAANLAGADLSGANLRGANLAGADLRYASGLPLAPAIPDIDAAILAAIAAPGCALSMKNWHTCATTHCRAGWAMHLAGEAGAMLETVLGPSVAAALIYAASGSHPVPDWAASEEDSMADLRKRAGVEVKA